LLQTIDGVGKDSSVRILSEVGADMSQFVSEHHQRSWAGMSPGNNESGGKKKQKNHPRKQIPPIKLGKMRMGSNKKKNGYLKRKYESLVVRRGKKKALVAVGHKIIIAAYHVIKNKEKHQRMLQNYSKQIVEVRT